MNPRLFFILIIAAALVALPNAAALAHGEPVIVVEPSVVAAGGQIMVTGSEMEIGETFAISLEGTAGSTALGEAEAIEDGEAGGFEMEFMIPVDAVPGSYLVRATAEDGDSTTADLEITAPSSEASSAPAEMVEPSGEQHILDRTKSPGEIAGVVLVIALSAVGGFVLVRRK